MLTLLLHMLPALPLDLLQSAPPVDPTNLVTSLIPWLVKLLSAVAMLFLIINLFKHITSSPPDFRAVGMEILGMVIMIAIATKAEAIVTWARTALG